MTLEERSKQILEKLDDFKKHGIKTTKTSMEESSRLLRRH